MSEVYKAIAEVQAELAKTGIAKNRKNTQGTGYMFRGIDDVYGALAPLLSKHGLCVIPRMIEREVAERTSSKGGALFYTTVKAEFDFVGVKDGSVHTACTYGEAMDSGDKSTNKAMSAAYKYAAFLTFAIPTEGDNDADATTHEVRARNDIPPRTKLAGPYTSKTALWQAARDFDRELRSCGDISMLDALTGSKEFQDFIKQLERDAPNVARTGDGLPDEFEPIIPLMAKIRSDLLANENTPWEPTPLAAG